MRDFIRRDAFITRIDKDLVARALAARRVMGTGERITVIPAEKTSTSQ